MDPKKRDLNCWFLPRWNVNVDVLDAEPGGLESEIVSKIADHRWPSATGMVHCLDDRGQVVPGVAPEEWLRHPAQ